MPPFRNTIASMAGETDDEVNMADIEMETGSSSSSDEMSEVDEDLTEMLEELLKKLDEQSFKSSQPKDPLDPALEEIHDKLNKIVAQVDSMGPEEHGPAAEVFANIVNMGYALEKVTKVFSSEVEFVAQFVKKARDEVCTQKDKKLQQRAVVVIQRDQSLEARAAADEATLPQMIAACENNRAFVVLKPLPQEALDRLRINQDARSVSPELELSNDNDNIMGDVDVDINMGNSEGESSAAAAVPQDLGVERPPERELRRSARQTSTQDISVNYKGQFVTPSSFQLKKWWILPRVEEPESGNAGAILPPNDLADADQPEEETRADDDFADVDNEQDADFIDERSLNDATKICERRIARTKIALSTVDLTTRCLRKENGEPTEPAEFRKRMQEARGKIVSEYVQTIKSFDDPMIKDLMDEKARDFKKKIEKAEDDTANDLFLLRQRLLGFVYNNRIEECDSGIDEECHSYQGETSSNAPRRLSGVHESMYVGPMSPTRSCHNSDSAYDTQDTQESYSPRVPKQNAKRPSRNLTNGGRSSIHVDKLFRTLARRGEFKEGDVGRNVYGLMTLLSDKSLDVNHESIRSVNNESLLTNTHASPGVDESLKLGSICPAALETTSKLQVRVTDAGKKRLRDCLESNNGINEEMMNPTRKKSHKRLRKSGP